MVCISRPYHLTFFKSCLPQILLDPFLNTFTQLLLIVSRGIPIRLPTSADFTSHTPTLPFNLEVQFVCQCASAAETYGSTTTLQCTDLLNA